MGAPDDCSDRHLSSGAKGQIPYATKTKALIFLLSIMNSFPLSLHLSPLKHKECRFLSRVEDKISRDEGNMSRVEGRISRVQKCRRFICYHL